MFDLDSEILDMTLPFSETGRSFTLLHGFLLTQEKCFNLKFSVQEIKLLKNVGEMIALIEEKL